MLLLSPAIPANCR